MTVAVIVLAIALAAAVGALVAMSLKYVGQVSDANDHATDARIGQHSTELELERRDFEIETIQRALVSVTKRAEALEQIIAEELNASNSDLDPADWRTRELRLAAAWAAADSNRVRAAADRSVPEAPATNTPGADLSSPTGVDGV